MDPTCIADTAEAGASLCRGPLRPELERMSPGQGLPDQLVDGVSGAPILCPACAMLHLTMSLPGGAQRDAAEALVGRVALQARGTPREWETVERFSSAVELVAARRRASIAAALKEALARR